MPGAPISRWTMTYFAVALLFLAMALVALCGGFGLPAGAPEAPETLAIVHMVTIGWLGMLFSGALLQFVPVLAASALRLPWLAAPSLLALTVGLVSMVLGFVALGGHLALDTVVLPAGAALASIGFAGIATSLGATVFSGREVGPPGMLVLLGLSGFAITAATGDLFSLLLSGVFVRPALAAILPDLVPWHAAAGLLGWMTATALGVSYRLFSMFMLAPETPNTARSVPLVVLAALCALAAMILLLLAGVGLVATVEWLAVAAAIAALLLYGYDILRMHRHRRRKSLELNMLAGLASTVFLCAGMLLLATSGIVETELHLGATGFYLLALGWLSGLGLAQLYKIVPFLTWLEVYGPVMGRVAVPRVQDLVNERRGRSGFSLYYVGVVAGAVAVASESDLMLQAASWVQLIAVVALVVEYVRARRLHYAPDALRLPPGTVRPHLIYALTHIKE